MSKPSTVSDCRRGIAAPLLRPLALAISVLLLGGGLGGAASAASFPATVNLGSLNGNNGFRVDGVAARDFSGSSVSAAGDINGDGLGDLIVGASFADPNGISYSGSSYVVYGQSTPFAPTLALSSLDGSNGFGLDGVAEYDNSGVSVSAAGDINGDGLGDLIVGANVANGSGSSYVVYGQSAAFAATLALSSLNGSNGFRLDGVAANDSFGSSVSAAGDINGDGLGDLIVGARSADPNGLSSGSSYVVYGQSTPFAPTLALSSLNGSNGFRLDGVAFDDRSGSSVSAAGDINGDGLGDLIVGAFRADPNGGQSGSSYVVYGQSTAFAATLALSSLNGSNGFRLDGVAADDRSGISVSAAGDINGDGLGDLIVGASRADPNGNSDSGSSYVVYGQSTPFASTLALSSLNGSNGFRLDGVAATDRSGTSVSAAGDINGDGLGDLIVGAFFADSNGNDASGSSYVVYGQSTPFAPTLALASLNGSNGFRLDGVAFNDRSGSSVSAAGDINGDGLDDLIVGAFLADPNGTSSGSSYVVFGREPMLAINPGTLSFVDTNVGQTSAAQTLTLSNTGTGNLDLGALALSGTNAGEFAFSADTCSSQTIVPTANCTVDLSFTPSATGARSAQIDIPSNAPSSPDAVPLTGTGLQPALSLAPDPQDFGDVLVGSSSAAQTITLGNPGDGILSVSAISAAAAPFAFTGGTCGAAPFTVLAGADCTFSYSFSPTATGPFMQTFTVSSDAPLAADNQFTLQGTGVQESTITTISSDTPDPSVVGQPYTVNVSVAGQTLSPNGELSISDGSDSCGPVTLAAGTAPNSTANCSLTSTTAGAKTLTASYTAATGTFGDSSGTASHQVDAAATTLSVTGPARMRVNTPTAFTAALAVSAPGAGSPAGVVTLSAGSSSCEITLPTATPSCSLSFDTLGARTINAAFVSANGNYLASTSSGAGDAQTVVFVLSDLAVSKTDTVSTYATGDLLVYTITLSHLGDDPAVNLRLLDSVPVALGNVAWTCTASAGAVCPASSGSGDIDALIPSYPVGALLTYTLSGNVLGNPPQIVNTATLELPADGTVEDVDLGNNSATDLNLRDGLFADGYETVTVTNAAGSYRLPSADLRRVLDLAATVVYVIDDANGDAARIYARVVAGQLHYALAQRASNGALRLGNWRSFSIEPVLSWTATENARGWVVDSLGLE